MTNMTLRIFALVMTVAFAGCTPQNQGNTAPQNEPPPENRESMPMPPANNADPGIGSSTFGDNPTPGATSTPAASSVPVAEMNNFITGMIKGGKDSTQSVLSSGTFSDYSVYRDGNRNGVVFEYVFSKSVTLNAANVDTVRQNLVKGLHAKKVMASMGKYMKAGLYLRYRYLRNDRSVHIDLNVTYDDMK
ncbi:hypothetical protein KKF84_04105 [Myxococcota bacterium]|nr:hypothetical protein [Myxococcota bacterium]MBU1534478.1 hypothetical protein [Myxococcota bacterium]